MDIEEYTGYVALSAPASFACGDKFSIDGLWYSVLMMYTDNHDSTIKRSYMDSYFRIGHAGIAKPEEVARLLYVDDNGKKRTVIRVLKDIDSAVFFCKGNLEFNSKDSFDEVKETQEVQSTPDKSTEDNQKVEESKDPHGPIMKIIGVAEMNGTLVPIIFHKTGESDYKHSEECSTIEAMTKEFFKTDRKGRIFEKN
ncbi:MAG: hypothetical protein J6Y02_14675 [Pseudobutyrivibrio sp.]|nr:hypothetical protein [Pseudobutyrivibrio sp.]